MAVMRTKLISAREAVYNQDPTVLPTTIITLSPYWKHGEHYIRISYCCHYLAKIYHNEVKRSSAVIP